MLLHVVCVFFFFKLRQAKSVQPWTLNSLEEEGACAEEIRPNFWPIEVHSDRFPEAHPDAIRQFTFKGRAMDGVYLPPDVGLPLPVGVIKLNNFDKKLLQKKTMLEKSDKELREGQGETTRAAARKHFHLGEKASATLAEPPPMVPVELKAVPKHEQEVAGKTKGTKRNAKAAGLDDEDNHDDADEVDFFAGHGFENGSDVKTPKGKGSKVGKTLKTANPKAKGTAKNASAKPPAKGPKDSNVPDWRARHNRQRKLQQVSQHLLLAKQQIETFETSMNKSNDTALVRYEKLLAEQLELDSLFLSYMKDDGGIVTGENLTEARSFVCVCVWSWLL